MLSLTVTGETAAEISRRLRDAAASFGAADMPQPTPAQKAAADAPKKEAAPKPTEVKKEEKPAPKAEPKKEAAKPASGATIEAVAAKIAELCENKTLGGKEKARELLGKYGAKKGGELKPDQIPSFIADVDAILHPAGEEEDGLM